jgi:hypothetical protein
MTTAWRFAGIDGRSFSGNLATAFCWNHHSIRANSEYLPIIDFAQFIGLCPYEMVV